VQEYFSDMPVPVTTPSSVPFVEKASTAETSVMMFRKIRSVDEVAAVRQLKPTTVYGHLAEAIAEGKLSLNEVINLTDNEFAEIERVFEICAQNAPGKLSPIFEKLEGKYNYDVLRCIGAARSRQA
jgi:ATP-dependent DNA helicase RecQ